MENTSRLGSFSGLSDSRARYKRAESTERCLLDGVAKETKENFRCVENSFVVVETARARLFETHRLFTCAFNFSPHILYYYFEMHVCVGVRGTGRPCQTQRVPTHFKRGRRDSRLR